MPKILQKQPISIQFENKSDFWESSQKSNKDGNAESQGCLDYWLLITGLVLHRGLEAEEDGSRFSSIQGQHHWGDYLYAYQKKVLEIDEGEDPFVIMGVMDSTTGNMG